MELKSREAKKSKRGIYLQDMELKDTVFKPGTHYRFVIDQENRKLVILSSDDEKDNVVCRRKIAEDKVKSVIDIRKREALSIFKECDYLQVTIHDDKVIVEGFAKEQRSLLDRAAGFVKRVIGSDNKVTDITDILAVKQKARIVLSIKDLEQAVGLVPGFAEQLSFEWQEVSQAGSVISLAEYQRIALKVVSLFSGAGLLDYGFMREGFDFIFAVDIEKGAVQTYRHNIGDHIVHGNIYDVTVPDAPIAIGGSPCKGFSNANRTKRNYLDDPNNKLVLEYINKVKSMKNCKIFVLENVPQIMTAGDGAFKDEIYEALSDFEINSGILHATDFGCAQDRDRAIFIGSKIGKIELPKPMTTERMTVREALVGITPDMPNQKDVTNHSKDVLERISYVPPGGNWENIPEHLRVKGIFHNSYRRLSYDDPSCTICNFRKPIILHPEHDRILSVREAARLQGVPDDFVFKGGLGSMQDQVANGVAVPMARAIAGVIRAAIERYNLRFAIG